MLEQVIRWFLFGTMCSLAASFLFGVMAMNKAPLAEGPASDIEILKTQVEELQKKIREQEERICFLAHEVEQLESLAYAYRKERLC